MFSDENRPEWSPLARLGDAIWTRAIDPAYDGLSATMRLPQLRRLRGAIQVILLFAVLLLPVSLFWSTGHVLTASGLLFDIAGAAQVFMLEEIEAAVSAYSQNEAGNLPSVAMREFVMPEAHPHEPDKEVEPISRILLPQARRVLFLFVGFALQMVGDFMG